MRKELVVHYMTIMLDKLLEGLSEKLPNAPLSAVRQNVLNMSQDGGFTTVLNNFCSQYYDMITELQQMKDEDANINLPFPTVGA